MEFVTRFRKIWIWILIIGLIVLMFSFNSRRIRNWNFADRLIIEIAAPFQEVMGQAIRAVKGIWFGYFQLVNVRQENRRLWKENDDLIMENSYYRELLGTYERLGELLQFRQRIKRPAIAAQVTGLDPTGWFKSIIINKGEEAGVKLDMPVVHSRGVVGRIVSVSKNYAKVLLVIDQNSAVDCLVQRSRARGMAKGLMTAACKLDYVAKSSEIAVGDRVITSGLGGVFPKGLLFGRVSKVNQAYNGLFQDIEISPAVDFSKLEEVLVITGENLSSNHHEKKM